MCGSPGLEKEIGLLSTSSSWMVSNSLLPVFSSFLDKVFLRSDWRWLHWSGEGDWIWSRMHCIAKFGKGFDCPASSTFGDGDRENLTNSDISEGEIIVFSIESDLNVFS